MGISFMTPNPLDILKSGLATLTQAVDTRKTELLSHLQKQEKISDEDEEWLDNEANYVDEVVVVELLEKAPNYQDGFAKLSKQQRDLVEKLKKLGGEAKKDVGKKRKCVSVFMFFY